MELAFISFFAPEEEFLMALGACDFFYMAGFQNKNKYVEDIFKRDDPGMTRSSVSK